MAMKTKVKATELIQRIDAILAYAYDDLVDVVKMAKDRGRSPRIAEIMIRKKLYKASDKFDRVLKQ